MEPWIRYAIALFLIAHGLIYASTPLWAKAANIFAQWKGSSALMGGAVAGETLKTLATAFWVIAGLGFLVAGVSIALVTWLPGGWRPAMIAAALVGTLSFLVFWDGQAQQLSNQGAIGVAIDLVALALALAFPQAFA